MKVNFKDNEDGLTLNGSWYLAVSIVFFRPLLFQKSHFSAPSLITSQFSNLRYHPPPKKYQLSLWPNNPPLLHFHFSRGCLFHSHTQRETWRCRTKQHLSSFSPGRDSDSVTEQSHASSCVTHPHPSWHSDRTMWSAKCYHLVWSFLYKRGKENIFAIAGISWLTK